MRGVRKVLRDVCCIMKDARGIGSLQVGKEPDDCRLSEKNQRLLMRFVDGECSCLMKRKARRLIRRNRDAQLFLDNILLTGSLIKEHCEDINGLLPHSWSVKESVLGMIERFDGRPISYDNATLLGSDTKVGEMSATFQEHDTPGSRAVLEQWRLKKERGLRPRLDFATRFGFGMTGAFTATAAICLIVPLYSPVELSGNKKNTPRDPLAFEVRSPTQSINGERAHFVSATSESKQQGRSRISPKIFFNRGRELVLSGRGGRYGVDWFRGGGRVQFVRSREARGPVMWISRMGDGLGRINLAKRSSTGSYQLAAKAIPTVSFVGGRDNN